MHIYNSVSSDNEIIRARIQELLDLDTDVIDEVRESELREILDDQVIKKFKTINSESELADFLRGTPQIAAVPKPVIDYLKL